MNPSQILAFLRLLVLPIAQVLAALVRFLPPMSPQARVAVKLAGVVIVAVGSLMLAYASGAHGSFDFASALRSILDAAAGLL